MSVNDWLVYVWLEPEDYIDSNDNGQYDISEIFTDLNGNGIWDATNEPFLDCGFIDCVTFEGELICEYDDQWGQAWIDEIVESIWVCEGDEIWNDLVGNGTWDSNRVNVGMSGGLRLGGINEELLIVFHFNNSICFF